MELDQSDRVLLQLYECTVLDNESPVSVSTLCQELNVPETVVSDSQSSTAPSERVDRLSVLASLDTLAARGFAAECEPTSTEKREPQYELTAEGRSEAVAIRTTLTTEPVRVRVGDQYREMSMQESLERVIDGNMGEQTGLAALLEAQAEKATSEVSVESIDGITPVSAAETERFIGRQRPWSQLTEIAKTARRGHTRTVVVSGAGGVGKTTLVSRFLEWAQEQGFQTGLGTTRPAQTTAYQPFRTALAPLFEKTGTGDPFESARGSLLLEEPSTVNQRQTGLYAEVADAVEQIATHEPLLVVLEDLHSASAATVALFQYLAGHLSSRVVLLGTARTNELAASHPLCNTREWAGSTRVRELCLEPFDEATTKRLIRAVLDDPAVPESFVEAVYRQTDGNPLFVTKTIEALRERRAISVADGVYPAPDEELPYPAEVSDAITQRFSRLSETTWKLIGTAAVISSPVDRELLTAAVDMTPDQIENQIAQLENASVLRAISGDRFRFTSGVVEETVLDFIDPVTRRQLHENVAKALLDADTPADIEPGRVAYHYEAADKRQPAIEKYIEAAESATKVYAYDEAVEYYESALSLARGRDQDDRVVSVLEELARVEFLAGDHARAIDHLETARERAADRDLLCRLARRQSEMNRIATNHERALAVTNDAVERDDSSTPSREVALLLGERAKVHRAAGDLDAAISDTERQLALATSIGDDELIGTATANRGMMASHRGNHEEAVERYTEAIELLESTDDRSQLAKVYNNLAAVRFFDNDLLKAREALEQALELQIEVGDKVNTSLLRMNLGSVHVELGNLTEAKETLSAALESFQRFQQPASVACTRGYLSSVLAHQGQLTPAGAMARAALRAYETDGGVARNHARFLNQYTEWLLDRNHPETGRNCAQKALDIATAADASAEAVQACCLLVRAHRETGDLERASELAATAREDATEIDTRRCTNRAHREFAKTQLATGTPQRALEAAEIAREMANETPNPWQVIDAKETYGRCLHATEQYERAERELREAHEEAVSVGGVPRICRTKYQLGRHYLRRGDETNGLQLLRSAKKEADEIEYYRVAWMARQTMKNNDTNAA